MLENQPNGSSPVAGWGFTVEVCFMVYTMYHETKVRLAWDIELLSRGYGKISRSCAM